jgi:hypothetical protein
VPVDHIKRSAFAVYERKPPISLPMEAGGKVDFALDAMFNITEHVPVDGDCGWEYEDF